jgi:hypothetical protein
MIIIAFFFTMPIRRMIPNQCDHPKLASADQQRKKRTDTRRRQRRKNRDRMNIALVKHTEHDINGDDRRENEPRFVFQRRLKCGCRSLK